MSERIDVLMVMADCMHQLDWGPLDAMNLGLKLTEARNAVSELIDAAAQYRELPTRHAGERLDAALHAVFEE